MPAPAPPRQPAPRARILARGRAEVRATVLALVACALLLVGCQSTRSSETGQAPATSAGLASAQPAPATPDGTSPAAGEAPTGANPAASPTAGSTASTGAAPAASATPASATPASATPASATPASATPTSATPASATPASATPAASEAPAGALPIGPADPSSITPLAEPGAEDARERYIRANLSMRYRYRRTGDESDEDAFAVVSADIGDADRDQVTAYVMGRAIKDVGGSSADPSTFQSLQDSRGGSLDLQLFEGFVDVQGAQGMQTVRIGRQWLSQTPAQVNLDGVLMETGPQDVMGSKLGVYGGLPNHQYESSQSGDRVMGTWLESRPWKGGRVRLDWMSLVDDQGTDTRRNDLIGLDVNHLTRTPLQLRTRWSWLDSETRDGELAATWNDPEQELLVQASWREQMNTQTDLVNELDPYSAVLQAFEPFTQKRLLASKGFGGRFTLEGGIDTRDLEDAADEGEFNREFDRLHLTGTVYDVLVEGVSVGLTGERWDSDDSDTSSWGLDVTSEVTDDLRVSGGTYYDLFKNDYLLDRETERVRTYYARLRYRIDPARTLSAGVDYESSDLDHYTTLTAKMTWRF